MNYFIGIYAVISKTKLQATQKLHNYCVYQQKNTKQHLLFSMSAQFLIDILAKLRCKVTIKSLKIKNL